MGRWLRRGKGSDEVVAWEEIGSPNVEQRVDCGTAKLTLKRVLWKGRIWKGRKGQLTVSISNPNEADSEECKRILLRLADTANALPGGKGKLSTTFSSIKDDDLRYNEKEGAFQAERHIGIPKPLLATFDPTEVAMQVTLSQTDDSQAESLLLRLHEAFNTKLGTLHMEFAEQRRRMSPTGDERLQTPPPLVMVESAQRRGSLETQLAAALNTAAEQGLLTVNGEGKFTVAPGAGEALISLLSQAQKGRG